jgi:hypothetical protein
MKLWVAILIFISSSAFAQLDPSSGLLLNSDPRTSHRESGLDSGRYTVRPHSDVPANAPKKVTITKATEKTIEKSEEIDENEKIQAPVPIVVPVVEQKALPPIPSDKPAESDVSSQTQKPALITQSLSPIDEKKKNIVEISIAPIFIYNHSSSELSSRNYSTSGPGYLLDVGAWIQPNFALHAQIINSLASSLNDSYDRTRNANLTQQWISGGLRYKNFLSSQKNASSVSLGVDYEDYQFQVDSDSHVRNRLETSGVNLSLLAEIPQSSKYSWEIGVEFLPKAKHQETLTSASLQSGDSPDADVVGISLGGRIYIDSSNQMFWKISERIEKDQFSGDTSKPDPASGQTQTNVSVTNSFTLIQIGYTWGN